MTTRRRYSGCSCISVLVISTFREHLFKFLCLTLCHRFRPIGMRPRDWKVGFVHCAFTAQIFLSLFTPCTSFTDIFRATRNTTLLQSLMYFFASIKHSFLVATKLSCFFTVLKFTFLCLFQAFLSSGGPDSCFVLRIGIDACDSDVRDRIGRIWSRRSSLCYNRISFSDTRDTRNVETRWLGVGNKRLICNVELGLHIV